jgi:glycerol-3-phosphate O-acyltransferase / dihydroxyacetone phosphate acyltransferase
MVLKSPGAQIHDPNVEYAYQCLPKVDQSNVFKHVEEALGNGGCIAMFPEGGSHDNSDLLPFKAGIAMMTFGTIIKTG